MSQKIEKTDAEWQKELDPLQHHVLRNRSSDADKLLLLIHMRHQRRSDIEALWNDYSGLIFVARIKLPHFSVSSATSLPNPAGEPGSAVPPNSASRALIFGSARPALISLLSGRNSRQ